MKYFILYSFYYKDNNTLFFLEKIFERYLFLIVFLFKREIVVILKGMYNCICNQ